VAPARKVFTLLSRQEKRDIPSHPVLRLEKEKQ
jgi:hypothetical protein